MCSICPRCSPPVSLPRPVVDEPFVGFSPILPVPVDVDGDGDNAAWSDARLFEFPIGGVICSCPSDMADGVAER